MVKSKQEVENFICHFMEKFKVWGIIFINREKNQQALIELGISSLIREEIVGGIEAEDYVETITDTASWGDMWVFGKDYSGQELYIKISLGKPGTQTICISFHKAEFPIHYAFK